MGTVLLLTRVLLRKLSARHTQRISNQKALDLYGTGTTSSRIASGFYAIHRELERELAAFLNRKHSSNNE
jgi:7-keto-8-aminopelargonate synthetase-like enzyme